ncbi:3-phosphoinositide-dependent protein kinase [Skeletonema marinoi]|uniref:non-specific serine/threonine protein kinase n=1 Tax=Skeletonema marinoi TaxID=267567 RepID=A0AAD8Y5F0_9STRA|nr:3-phosphoinositide-dependent protein kinase [Skeletonema marinoi]
MEESPVILPTLKFHDLVFGQELGTGAFSTVKYARQILKDKTRSHWPEFAVKIVSTQKIEALGYEQSINREIAILRTISHPGISRLISSFRFREGAYLVLEFASGGDLHTLLRKNGSLDHESTKFVIGSVAAALWSIHERGFVFVDIKPENILITESGHIKLTDFGGCRPVTQEAKLSVKGSSENLLKELRDGDWKQAAPKKTEQKTEGTTAYLPPEVVIGGLPTYAADIWALGCVLFQCLSGRPPILEDTDHLTAQRIVSFHLSDGSSDVFVGCDETAFNDCAKTLVQQMLHREAPARPDIFEISQSAFFDGVDIFNLHKKPAHPLDVGSIAPVSDAKWARRQFSSIWAPQPHVYDIGGTSNVTTKARNSWDSAILEGGERDETFATTQKAILTKISE